MCEGKNMHWKKSFWENRLFSFTMQTGGFKTVETKRMSVPLWYRTWQHQSDSLWSAYARVTQALAFICQKKAEAEWVRESRDRALLWKWRLIRIQWSAGGWAGVNGALSLLLFSLVPSLSLCSLPWAAGVVGVLRDYEICTFKQHAGWSWNTAGKYWRTPTEYEHSITGL